MTHSRFTAALLTLAAAQLLTSNPAFAAEPNESAPARSWRLGTELDALPFATGGYYGSVVAARDAWRIRGVAARSTVPGFMVSDGFKDKRTDAYAFLVDRFLGPRREHRQGFWIGGGVELWRNRIRHEGVSSYTQYSNVMLTAGGGYVWQISRHFYLNPWAGAHFAVAGERQINVSGRLYQQPMFTPEASIKLGFTF
jgi:hypothetical protein